MSDALTREQKPKGCPSCQSVAATWITDCENPIHAQQANAHIHYLEQLIAERDALAHRVQELEVEQICSVCKSVTDEACSDCRIDLSTTVYVCHARQCRNEHEKKCPGMLQQERAAIQQVIKKEFAKKEYTDEDREHNDVLENIGVFLDHHDLLEQRVKVVTDELTDILVCKAAEVAKLEQQLDAAQAEIEDWRRKLQKAMTP